MAAGDIAVEIAPTLSVANVSGALSTVISQTTATARIEIIPMSFGGAMVVAIAQT